jgi:hypothetical protein
MGETKRQIRTRLKEHETACRLSQPEKSALAEHHVQTGHLIDFNGAKKIAVEDRWWRRKLREAIEIEKEPRVFNRDSGAPLRGALVLAIPRAISGGHVPLGSPTPPHPRGPH